MKKTKDHQLTALGLLPTELLCEIFNKLSAKEIFKLCLVCRSWYDCIMMDETFMNIVWKNVSERLVHEFYYMFLRPEDNNISSSLRIDMIKNNQRCKLVDGDFIDDDDLIINSPLKTTTTFSKFKKENVVRKILRLSPNAIRSKLYFLHISDNTKNAALMNTSLVKTIADLITNKSITISIWFRLQPHSTGGVLFGVQNSPFAVGTAFVPIIYITNNLMLRAGFWGANFMEFSEILTDNKWQHVALTKSNKVATLYYNGKAVGTIVPDHNFDHHTHKLYHGQIGSGLCDRWPGSSMNYTYNCYTFVGDIADVNIYSKELNEQQVKEEMICAQPQPSLLASWSFTDAVVLSQAKKMNEVASVPSGNKCSAPTLTVIGEDVSISTGQ
ncbi:hypothetical protein FDP41_010496 [Naegleria fowleri]|uniref:F-box domain-containing protein n=1 Tax=Naegleria fowleri TaxID=5763 RepID=A0A6A5C8G5_NAEFO|nr:uncharacterized protein FDP41_010496 [Naegleria fowleri]KAF0983431.1 hypothetical protein FDP41_010496 [Naegleria fowleri]CAG4708619.1 unnamed protein product [Naegleria fowleri]